MEVFEDEDAAAAVPARYWNHNAAYHRMIRRAVPDGARDLLDVGCGDGRLARELARPGRRVLGLDPDAALLARAAGLGEGIAGLEFERGEFLAYELPPGSFDFVCFLASLHHMDQAAALGRAREVLRPGGRLVVIGLARATTVREEVVSGAFAPLAWFGGLRPDHVYTEGMRTVEPELGWGETRDLARRVLPGRVRYRRRLYFRYSLRWTKPAAGAS
jgi:SAM-dependent methyltransferase